jgi:hypothetical protein
MNTHIIRERERKRRVRQREGGREKEEQMSSWVCLRKLQGLRSEKRNDVE